MAVFLTSYEFISIDDKLAEDCRNHLLFAKNQICLGDENKLFQKPDLLRFSILSHLPVQDGQLG